MTSPFTTAAQWAATTAHGDIAADYNGQNGFTSATYIAEAAARMLEEDAEMAAEREAMMAAYNNEHQDDSSDYDFEQGDNGQFGFGFGMNGKLKKFTFYGDSDVGELKLVTICGWPKLSPSYYIYTFCLEHLSPTSIYFFD